MKSIEWMQDEIERMSKANVRLEDRADKAECELNRAWEEKLTAEAECDKLKVQASLDADTILALSLVIKDLGDRLATKLEEPESGTSE